MRAPRLVRVIVFGVLFLTAIALVADVSAQSPTIFPKPTPGRRATPDGEPSSLVIRRAPRKPMPLALKIGIVFGGLGVAALGLVVSMRAWRSSNLFDRQYRFPAIESVAVRLGGPRSGGCMAVLNFEEPKNDLTAEHS